MRLGVVGGASGGWWERCWLIISLWMLALDKVALGVQPNAGAVVVRFTAPLHIHPRSYHLPMQRIRDLLERLSNLTNQPLIVLYIFAASSA